MIFISIKNDLSEFLQDYEKLLILGVGNELKCDDGVGPFIIKKLEKELSEDNIVLINGETVPENFTGKIKKDNPSHIIILDACLMDEEPGTVKVVNSENFINIGISTHSMSLSYFVKYLTREHDFKIIFIGIEPESMDYNENLTEVVEKNALKLIEIIKGII